MERVRYSMIMVVVLLAAGMAQASFETIAYWELDGANWNGADAAGSHNMSLLGTVTSSNLRINPIPNPDISDWNNESSSAAANPAACWFNGAGVWFTSDAASNPVWYDEMRFNPEQSFTVEGWFRPRNSGIVIGNQHHNTATHQTGGSYKGWRLQTLDNGTSLAFYIDGGPGAGQAVEIKAAVQYDQLQHFAAVYDSTEGEYGVMKLYIDGILQGTASGLSTWSLSRGGAVAIGGRDTGNGVFDGLRFNGGIDEIRYVAAALSPEYFLNGTIAIPEPSTLVLLSLAAGIVFARKKAGDRGGRL